MSPDEYINCRLDDQIDWYDRKSALSKRLFLCLRFVEIASAALIAFLAGNINADLPYVTLAVGTLGVVVAISAASASLFQFHENWIEYRTTAESLKKEKFIFLTKVEPYDNLDDAFSLLVHRVETLISKENTNWAQYIMNQDEDRDNGR